MKTNLTSLILSIISIFVFSESQSACTCGLDESCGASAAADVVFIGKLKEIKQASREEIADENRRIEVNADEYKFAVSELFSGSEKARQIVLAGEGTTCDVSFKPGEFYLIYAFKTAAGRYTTSICTPTKLLSQAVKELDFLRGIAAGSETTDFSGIVFNSSKEKGETDFIIIVQDLSFPNKTFKLITDEKGVFIAEIPAGKYKVVPSLGEKFVFDTNFMTAETEKTIELEPGGCASIGFIVRNK